MDYPFHPRSGPRHQYPPVPPNSHLPGRIYPVLYGNNWNPYRTASHNSFHQHLPYQYYSPGQERNFSGKFRPNSRPLSYPSSPAAPPPVKTERILRTSLDTIDIKQGKKTLNVGAADNKKVKPRIPLTKSTVKSNKLGSVSSGSGAETTESMEKENQNSSGSQPSPQYRIFKRGDALPGFSSPLELITGMNIQRTEIASSPGGNSTVNKFQNHDFNKTSNNVIEQNELQDKRRDSSSDRGDSKTPASKTATSLVTDLARFHGLNPEYRLTSEVGPPHAPTFTIVLNLGTEQYEATGPSIKKAQLAAAAKAMESTELEKPPPRGQPKKTNFRGNKNQGGGIQAKRPNWSINQLNALAEELNQKVTFSTQPPSLTNNLSSGNSTVVSVHLGDKVFTGEGRNIHAAKNNAAQQALHALMQIKQDLELAKMLESTSADALESTDNGIKSPISIVHEMALKRGKKVSFEIVSEEGPPHMKVYSIKCVVGEIETQGCGPTKQAAKKSSCEQMIEKLRDVPLKQPKLSSLKMIQNSLYSKPKVARKKPTTPIIKEVDKQVVSPISRLLHIAHVRKYKEPEFVVIKQADDNHSETNSQKQDKRTKKKKPFFTMQVNVGPYTCEGSGPNKKAAKKAAADNALVALGYAPSVTPKEHSHPASSVKSDPSSSSDVTSISACSGTSQQSKERKSKQLKITSARQILPGVLMIKSENTDDSPNAPVSETDATETSTNVTCSPSDGSNISVSSMEGIQKLGYLAQLLDIAVSYTNFPKKDGFLSVAILGANPPRMAHGVGPTVEEAQNAAATEILAELATTGLDGVSMSASTDRDVKPAVKL